MNANGNIHVKVCLDVEYELNELSIDYDLPKLYSMEEKTKDL